MRKLQWLWPLLIYTATSVLLFGMFMLRDPAHTFVGRSTTTTDPSQFMWCLAWWPHALRHQLNAFLTDVWWTPVGINLAWTTCVPGASLLVAPLTLAAGPVVAYNAWCLLALPLAAWTAFVLCKHLTQAFWPALVGGYLFGFSTYELGHLQSHLHMILTFPIPLCLYFVFLKLENTLKSPAFVVLLGLALALQFSFSMELLATMTMMGGLTMFAAYVMAPVDLKQRLAQTSALILYAYALAMIVLSPYLYYVFVGIAQGVAGELPDWVYYSRLNNFVIPTPITLIGHEWNRLAYSYDENVAYVGIPLLLIIADFSRRYWRTLSGRLLIGSFLFACVLSMGPTLRVFRGDHPIAPLPWSLILHLPLLNQALPPRLMAYAFLAAAIIVAVWTSDPTVSRMAKWVLVPLSVVCLLPNPRYPLWNSPVDTPEFFTSGLFKHYMSPGEVALVLPYGYTGNSALWQAQSEMSFRMAEGPAAGTPPEYKRWPIVTALYNNTFGPGDRDQLKAFLRAHGVGIIVVANGAPGAWREMFSALGLAPTTIGGVTLYDVTRMINASVSGNAPPGRRPVRPAALEVRTEVGVLSGEGRGGGEVDRKTVSGFFGKQ